MFLFQWFKMTKRFLGVSPVCVLAVSLLLGIDSHADQILLNDGKVVEGKIIRESDTLVTIEVDTIAITLLKKDIDDIRVGDNLFGPTEEEVEPQAPVEEAGVLPNLRQTAAALSNEQEDTPTHTPSEPPRDTPTDTPTKVPPTRKEEQQAPKVEVPTPPAAEVEEVAQEEILPKAEDPEPTPEAEIPKVDPEDLPQGQAYELTNEYANIRKGPSTRNEKIGKLLKGTLLIVDEVSDKGWIHFTAPETGTVGWMSGRLASKLADTPMVVSSEKVNFRTGPSTAYTRIGEFHRGDVMKVLIECASLDSLQNESPIKINSIKGQWHEAYIAMSKLLGQIKERKVEEAKKGKLTKIFGR